MVSIRAEQEALWSLTADRKKARLALPALAIEGHSSPIKVSMVFDAWTVDAMIERLLVLRSQMLPPLPARVRNQGSAIAGGAQCPKVHIVLEVSPIGA
jgi:hypothetical protein